MKPFCFYIIFIFTSHFAQAQVAITGSIKDTRGKKIISASITLANTYDGATSDSSGNYSFMTSEKGAYVLTASAVGYKCTQQPVVIADSPITIHLVLKEAINELKAVTVTAGSFAAGDTKRAVTVLNSLDVATVGGGNADITSALRTLPGTQQVGEQEGLFVRGGAGYETKQFIDGTLVNNPYFSSAPDIASRGRFSPFLFKGTVFSAGGYSALYGQALSSAVILESIDLPEQTAANASFSPIFVGGGYQYLNKKKTASWGVNYGYVNLAAYFQLVKQTPDYFIMPRFHNGDANFRFKTKSGGMVKYYTTLSTGNLGLRRPDIDSLELKDAFSLNNVNWYNNLSWRENLGKGWKMNIGSGFSTNNDQLAQRLQNRNNEPQNFGTDKFWLQYKNFDVNRREDVSQIKTVFEKKFPGLNAIRFGGEYWYSVSKTTAYDSAYKLTDHYRALFAEGDVYITNSLAAKFGARFEHSSILGKANFAPRISLAYKTGAGGSVSAAYGIYYQKPENQQLFYTRSLGYTRADHYILNYQKTTTGRIFRIEAFYKQYTDLVKTIPVSWYNSIANNNGTGYAQGIELFWRDKKSFKNLDYWFSYSYLDTKRDYLNYPMQLQPNFAARHTASLVMKRFVMDWKTGFALTYSFATGRPYYNLRYEAPYKPYTIADRGYTKNFNNLGVSMYYVPQAGNNNAKTNVVLFGSVTNVLGYDAVFGYNYSYDGSRKVAVTQPARRFIFIGAFFSWGVDRSQDAINNNL